MPIKKETFFVFDMDGVILDSLDNLSNCLIKAIEPFCQSDEQYQTFSKFDKENPGLSRFEKTDFFLASLPNVSHVKTEKIKQLTAKEKKAKKLILLCSFSVDCLFTNFIV